MSDNEIKQYIIDLLNRTSYELQYFERNHGCFGNMITKIKSGKQLYVFVSDRGYITCNEKFIIQNNSHIAGEDDDPIYLLKAIKKFFNI